MNRLRTVSLLAMALALSQALTVWADAGHPDIEVEVEHGNELHIHGGPILHSHDYFEFINAGSGWFTLHDSLTWPGVDAESGTFTGSDVLDLIIETPLYFWDGVASSFAPVTDGTVLNIKPTAFSSDTFIGGEPSSLPIVVPSIAEDNVSGGVHAHPIWQLIGDGGDPADGAYLIGIRIAAEGYETSNLVGILFHKGLTDEQYDIAESLAASLIPEPASLALLGAGVALIGLRRRRLA
jgi:hypothetical protein